MLVESSRVEVSLVVIVEYTCDGGVQSSFGSGMELRWYRVQLLVIAKMSRVESSCYSRV